MTSLQVRDLPEDIYQKLRLLADQENRSITQQVVVVLRAALNISMSPKEKRARAIEEIMTTTYKKHGKFENPLKFVREGRDR